MNRQTLVWPLAAAIVMAGGWGASRALAQIEPRVPTEGRRVLRVSGTAVVYAKPDYATMMIGSVKTAPRVSEAKAGADAVMRRAQDAVRKLGVKAEDIQTVNFQIHPVTPNKGARQWKVVHQVSVRVRAVEKVPQVIDAAVDSGATEVSNIDYGVEKILELRSKARAQAVAVARGKAQELAKLMGVQLGAPVTISDSPQAYYAYQMSNVAFRGEGTWLSSAAEGSPVRGGQIPISAQEDIEFSID